MEKARSLKSLEAEVNTVLSQRLPAGVIEAG